MNYIKLFEEFEGLGYSDQARFRKDLTTFCNEHLSFLLTDGFDVFVGEQFKEQGDDDSVMVTLRNDDTFQWDSIKSSFLSFYKKLTSAYTVTADLAFQIYDGMDYNTIKISIDDVLNDNVYDGEIVSIKMQVEY